MQNEWLVIKIIPLPESLSFLERAHITHFLHIFRNKGRGKKDAAKQHLYLACTICTCALQSTKTCGSPARLKSAGKSSGDTICKCETLRSINAGISENRMALCVFTSQDSSVALQNILGEHNGTGKVMNERGFSGQMVFEVECSYLGTLQMLANPLYYILHSSAPF